MKQAATKLIWIVDDDKEMGDAISLMLKLLDCETKYFDNPRPAAQALLSGGQPDLMILDINMPEVSGLDMLEFLRRRKECNDLPIVLLSPIPADVSVMKASQIRAAG